MDILSPVATTKQDGDYLLVFQPHTCRSRLQSLSCQGYFVLLFCLYFDTLLAIGTLLTWLRCLSAPIRPARLAADHFLLLA